MGTEKHSISSLAHSQRSYNLIIPVLVSDKAPLTLKLEALNYCLVLIQIDCFILKDVLEAFPEVRLRSNILKQAQKLNKIENVDQFDSMI